jgi:phage repressor protein C with HTH and peptisase S24 domain
MKFGERLREARTYLGLTQKELAGKLGFQWHKIKDIESEKLKLTPKIAQDIENFYSISGWWLLTGKGNMLVEENNSSSKEPPTNLISITYFKDTYAAAGAGALNYDEAPIVMAFEKEFLIEKLGITSFKHLHIINAIGDSMYPTIQTGELLFVNPFENENTLIRDTDIYVINTASGVLVKRIKVLDPINRKYALVSDNPKHDDIPLSGDDLEACKILGRVVGHFNKL